MSNEGLDSQYIRTMGRVGVGELIKQSKIFNSEYTWCLFSWCRVGGDTALWENHLFIV